MKTESKPTSSARHEKPSNLPGANGSADALYPSLITARLLADAVVPVAEIYRLVGNQQQPKQGNDHASLNCPAFRRHRWRWPDRARIRTARRGRGLRRSDAG